MAVKSYRDLDAWKEGIELVEVVYRVIEDFPSKEQFGLTNQIRRAVNSIPSNIAEGTGRDHSKEFLQFLTISRGSLFELETQLIIAGRLGYLSPKNLNILLVQTEKVARILSGLINSIRRKIDGDQKPRTPTTNHKQPAANTNHQPPTTSHND